MRYRFEPAIFASAPLVKRDCRWHLTSAFSQRLRKYAFTAVHTKTHRRRFQIYSFWRAFSNLCVYGECFHRLRVDGRPIRIKKFAFTSVCVYNRLRVDGAYVRTFHQKACCTCSTIIFLHTTNQIIDLGRCRWRCRRQILNSLMTNWMSTRTNAIQSMLSFIIYAMLYCRSKYACAHRLTSIP